MPGSGQALCSQMRLELGAAGNADVSYSLHDESNTSNLYSQNENLMGLLETELSQTRKPAVPRPHLSRPLAGGLPCRHRAQLPGNTGGRTSTRGCWTSLSAPRMARWGLWSPAVQPALRAVGPCLLPPLGPSPPPGADRRGRSQPLLFLIFIFCWSAADLQRCAPFGGQQNDPVIYTTALLN